MTNFSTTSESEIVCVLIRKACITFLSLGYLSEEGRLKGHNVLPDKLNNYCLLSS